VKKLRRKKVFIVFNFYLASPELLSGFAIPASKRHFVSEFFS